MPRLFCSLLFRGKAFAYLIEIGTDGVKLQVVHFHGGFGRVVGEGGIPLVALFVAVVVDVPLSNFRQLKKNVSYPFLLNCQVFLDCSIYKRLCPPKVLLNSNIPFTKPSFDAIYSMKGDFYVGSQRGYADVPVAFPG